MSNKTRSRIRSAAALKADAPLLTGDRWSRVAQAAIAGEPAPADAPAGSVGELWLYGLVGGWWRGFDAESVSNALRGLDVDTLYVRIHSPGGRAADGVAIGNLLRNHRAHIVSVVDGMAASAASVIAIAGDEVVMCPGSQMMLHDASVGTWGNAAQLRRDADWLDGQSNNYAGVYAYKAGGDAAKWRAVMLANDGEGTWYNADEAVAASLADEVGTRVAVGSPPVVPEDEIDDGDDDLLARIEHDLMLLEHHVHADARAAWNGAPPPKPPSASAVGSLKTEGGTAMSFSDQAVTTLRTKLGITAEDADEATILAALDEALDERSEPTAPTGPTAVAAGHVVVPEVRLTDLESAAATGVAAAAELHAMKREAFLDEHKTKFPATSRAEWGKRFDENATATRELLAAAGDLVPTGEVGHSDTDSANQPTSLAQVREDPTYKNWEI